MAKIDDLENLPRPALRRLVEWLEMCGRVQNDTAGWKKPELIECLAQKLTREQVSVVVAACHDEEPYFDDEFLAAQIGFPQKDVILDNASKADLRRAMEDLDRRGRVGIFWRSLGADELRGYLRDKCSKEELAALVWQLAPSGGEERRSRQSKQRPSPVARDSGAASREQRGELLFNRYELISRLTPGGMGDALKVRDTRTGSVCFMKRVRVDSRDEKSLRREAQIYNKLLNHEFDHVLAVHGVERDEASMALVLEFADGGTLTERVPDRGMPVREVRDIAEQICTGIAELHRLGVVHRDLKPHNVLRHSARWKLADFGIARDVRVQGTTTFKGAGTDGYGAPEQMFGTEAEASADIYSFGKIVTFMLTRQTDPDRIPAPAWQLFVHACTSRSPDARPSADDVLKQLARLG